MTIAASAKSRIAYVAETSYGVTPATPVFKELRRTGGNLATKKVVAESEEMSLDARTRDVYQLGQDVSGSYDIEFSYASFDDMLEAVMQGSFTTDVLTDGVSQKSFTFEETVDIGGGNFTYNRFVGCEVNSLSITLSSRAAVKGVINILGQKEITDTAIITGATYTAPNTNKVETTANVAAVSIAGLTPAPKVKEIQFTIDRGLRVRDTVGSLYTEEMGISTSKFTGSMKAYYETLDLYNQVLAHGSGAFDFTVGKTTAKKYTFHFPTMQFLDGNRTVGTRNTDVMLDVQLQAVGNASSPLLQITRAVA